MFSKDISNVKQRQVGSAWLRNNEDGANTTDEEQSTDRGGSLGWWNGVDAGQRWGMGEGSVFQT